MMYSYHHTIKLHETDAAGLLFFSHQFRIIHDAYESLLEKIGFGFATLIKEKPYFLPIVHAESDYKLPLFVGEDIVIDVVVEKIGETSFTFAYKIIRNTSELVGTAKTVHVTMNKQSKSKTPLPDDMRKALSKFTA